MKEEEEIVARAWASHVFLQDDPSVEQIEFAKQLVGYQFALFEYHKRMLEAELTNAIWSAIMGPVRRLRDSFRKGNVYRYVGRAYDPDRPNNRRFYDGPIFGRGPRR